MNFKCLHLRLPRGIWPRRSMKKIHIQGNLDTSACCQAIGLETVVQQNCSTKDLSDLKGPGNYFCNSLGHHSLGSSCICRKLASLRETHLSRTAKDRGNCEDSLHSGSFWLCYPTPVNVMRSPSQQAQKPLRE